MSLNFTHLPNEILFNIIDLLSPLDLSQTRNVCQKLGDMCSQPCYWRHIVLEAKPTNRTDQLQLWTLKELKEILDPHKHFIETIHIRGVRDNIMQYIFLECTQLRELTVCGWLTLSEHAFKMPKNRTSSLRRLCLIGDTNQQTNFLSLDSVTLGQLIAQSELQELSVACQAHFQAEGLIQSLEAVTTCSLQSLIISTKKTWCSQHITQLFEHCPKLKFLGLVPDGAHLGYDKNQEFTFSSETLLKAIVSNQIKDHNERLLLEKHSLLVEEEEMLLFDNIAIFNDF